MGRVLPREGLIRAVSEARARGQTIVFTNGCFDILHRGHAYYLEKAKALGDVLVVGVNTDRSVRDLKGAGRPIVSEDDRAHLVAALASVDMVSLFDEPTPHDLIVALAPDVLVKGAGYSEDTVVGADVVRARGGKVVLIEALEGRSTRSIIERIAGRSGPRAG